MHSEVFLFKKNFKEEEKGDIYQTCTCKFPRGHNSSDTCSPDYLRTQCTKTFTAAHMANFSHLEEANCPAYMQCPRILHRYTYFVLNNLIIHLIYMCSVPSKQKCLTQGASTSIC